MVVPNVVYIAIDVIDDQLDLMETSREKFDFLDRTLDMPMDDFQDWVCDILKEKALGGIPDFITERIYKDICSKNGIQSIWDWCNGVLNDVKLDLSDEDSDS